MQEQEYNGYKIRFDEKAEQWYAVVENDDRISNASIKKLKEMLDIMKRKRFDRLPCFVRTRKYRLGGGRDEKYDPSFEEATITSISPNGNAFFVRKGSKNAEKENLRYGSSIIVDTPANRKLIAEYETAAEAEYEAEKIQARAREKMTKYGEELYKSVYGKNI